MRFLVNLSPLKLFDIKLKSITGITCIYIKLRLLTHDNLSIKVERYVLKKIPLYEIIRLVETFKETMVNLLHQLLITV